VKKMYLVIGGAGRTGRRVADLLIEMGADVVIASRSPGRTPGARLVDLAKGIDPALLDGIDGVVVSVEPPADTAGAEAVLHRGVAALAQAAAGTGAQVVLLSQIYVTRTAEHPGMAGVILARARGEQVLRDSGAPYTIIRPSWLTDGPAAGVRLEQGDTGDGQVSRTAVAQAAAAALRSPAALGKTFELYDEPAAGTFDWPAAFARLTADAS
jgi:uncharacterized protein YbjT (DUF2867 family)